MRRPLRLDGHDRERVFRWANDSSDLFVYLERPEYGDTWINGGRIPLNPVSMYRAAERSGIYTPDEQLHRSFREGTDPDIQQMMAAMSDGHLMFDNCDVHDGTKLHTGVTTWMTGEMRDALVLCFARGLSRNLCRRLNKTIAVKVTDPIALLDHISHQLSSKGELRVIGYTNGHDRHHCLKSSADSWQVEARMLWVPEKIEQTWVEIPRGTGSLVDLTLAPNDLDMSSFDLGVYDRAAKADQEAWDAGMEANRRHYFAEHPEEAARYGIPLPMDALLSPDRGKPNRAHRRKSAATSRRKQR